MVHVENHASRPSTVIYVSHDPYLQLNGTLHNRLGISDAIELQERETAISTVRLSLLQALREPSGHFDIAHLKAIHQFVFGDIYEWAGVTRGERTTIGGQTFAPPPLLSKGESVFALGPQVMPYLNDLFAQLARDNFLQNLPRSEFARRAADLLGDLNAAHPFREGNGRTQREFMRQLAGQTGHPLQFSVVSQERMIRASIASTAGDPEPMRRLFAEITDPKRAEMLRGAIASLEGAGVDWNSLDLATAWPGQPYRGQVLLRGPDTCVLQVSDGLVVARTADLGLLPALGQTVTLQLGPDASS